MGSIWRSPFPATNWSSGSPVEILYFLVFIGIVIVIVAGRNRIKQNALQERANRERSAAAQLLSTQAPTEPRQRRTYALDDPPPPPPPPLS